MRYLFRTLVLVLSLSLVNTLASASEPFFYAGDNGSGTLYKIDKVTGATLTTIPVTLGGTQVLWIKGLAAEPVSGDLYAVVGELQPPDGPGLPVDFKLATIAPDTGIATEIGLLSDRFSGLAWVVLPAPTDGVPTGTVELMGVTGDGAAIPESLFIINTSNASTSLFMNLGNGTDGESIAFNSADGMLYHLSGSDPIQSLGGSSIVFEKIDLDTMGVTNIPLSGTPFTKGNGLTFDDATGQFFVSVDSGPVDAPTGPGVAQLVSLTTGGAATPVGPTDAYFGGTAFSYQVPVELQSFSIE